MAVIAFVWAGFNLYAELQRTNAARIAELETDIAALKRPKFSDEVRQHAEHERLKKVGHIAPWVFFRMVAQGRGGEPKPKPIRSLTNAWRVACRASGCPGRIPHDLRRTAVRNRAGAGIPERVAMQMTGHKTRSVFERYDIVSEGGLKDAARQLDAVQGRAQEA